MIAVDTNVVVRFLVQDDEEQYNLIRTLFQEAAEIFIPITIVLETEWVLRFAYKFTPSDVCRALRNLFGLPNVRLENALVIAQAISWHKNGLDFADALHLSHSQSCQVLYTFDQKFINRSLSISHTEVKHP